MITSTHPDLALRACRVGFVIQGAQFATDCGCARSLLVPVSSQHGPPVGCGARDTQTKLKDFNNKVRMVFVEARQSAAV